MNKAEAIKKLGLFYSRDNCTIMVTGKWGIGKSYFIKEFLEKRKNDFSEGYIKISAFGSESLGEIRNKIGFEYISSLGKNDKAKSTISNIINGIRMIPELPYLGNASTRLEEMGFTLAKSITIWIDDLERKSDKLGLQDLLGEVAFLTEERNCKIIIACNSEELHDPQKKQIFEKTINYSFHYDRDFDDTFKCAFEGPDVELWRKLLDEPCRSMATKNIRNLQRIRDYISAIRESIPEIPLSVLQQISMTISIAIESKYAGNENMPSLEQLRYWQRTYIPKDTKDPAAEAQKNFMDSLGYTATDDLDKILIDFVEFGNLDTEALQAKIQENSRKIQENEANAELRATWNLVHSFFNKGPDEIVAAFKDVLGKYPGLFHPRTYSEIIEFVRLMGKEDAALDLLSLIPRSFSLRRADRDFDISGSNDYKYQPEIRDRITLIEEPVKSLQEIISELSKGRGWNSSDEEVLASLSVEDYVSFFNECNDGYIDVYINRLLEFGTYANFTARQFEISNSTLLALEAIAKRSPLDQIRCRKFKQKMDTVASRDLPKG